MPMSDYSALALLAGEYLAGPVLGPYTIGIEALPTAPKKLVYIVENASREVRYVGSTTQGLRQRMAQHLRDRGKVDTWDRVYAIPLKDSCDADMVKLVEGRVGRDTSPIDGIHPRAW